MQGSAKPMPGISPSTQKDTWMLITPSCHATYVLQHVPEQLLGDEAAQEVHASVQAVLADVESLLKQLQVMSWLLF
jgi:hypothetical protein